MNITNISHSIIGPFDPGPSAPPIPSGGFSPTGNMEPVGTTLFSVDVPPDYLDIGSITISFGGDCTDAGGGGYLSKCELLDSKGSPLNGARIIAFTDTALPCYTTDPATPDNQMALDTLTCQFADDFQRWLSIQFDYVFAGAVNIQPNGFIDEIEVDYNAGMAKTRMRSMPLNGWPRELGHEDPDCQHLATGNLVLGVVTVDIPANSTNGPGMVQIYRQTNSGTVAIGSPVKVSNWFGVKVVKNKHVILGRIGCRFYVVSADC